MISCKQYWKSIEILSETKYYELAYLFVRFLLTNKLIERQLVAEENKNNADAINEIQDTQQEQQQQLSAKYSQNDLLNKIINNYNLFKKDFSTVLVDF